MPRRFLFFLTIVFLSSHLLAQDSLQTVVAEPGDGIFSILRKQGVYPKKYYEAFLKLNEGHIKNGSELKQGWAYKIPDAPDSFKKMGRAVSLPSGDETPLFETELAKLDLKSEELKDAVYYLIVEDSVQNQDFVSTIATNLASRLLVNGAKVYVIKVMDETLKKNEMALLQQYVDVVNKRYLKNQGKYQRLLLLRSNGTFQGKNLDLAFYHHDGSNEGQRLADNLEMIFTRNSKKVVTVENSQDVLKNKGNLFLAKNILPAITVLSISDSKAKSKEGKLIVRKDQKAMTQMIAKGMFQDYADLEIEE
ncbi:hypothetical protein [Allomuricauda sp. SCSIO 65647]|uniref:hypothetical protein n=1 Tax=Allomuricauda sp. SCSIO 65647 TaxID=2908843 RepID=UPI001F3EE0C7|nr:hypothetical protein [Muricauda sp. SCSIO 65647]UJH66282.1 hypothetical protein L0P89_09890 [Muricauda sp. SCSIO 65647]